MWCRGQELRQLPGQLSAPLRGCRGRKLRQLPGQLPAPLRCCRGQKLGQPPGRLPALSRCPFLLETSGLLSETWTELSALWSQRLEARNRQVADLVSCLCDADDHESVRQPEGRCRLVETRMGLHSGLTETCLVNLAFLSLSYSDDQFHWSAHADCFLGHQSAPKKG